MAAAPGAVYREAMSWVETARDWRPTAHALTGLAAGALTGGLLGGLVLGWLAAIWSLIEGPAGAPGQRVAQARVIRSEWSKLRSVPFTA